jgi:predicted ATPase/DNA-binding SARP family transcriptional activator/Tfp pilus assembly protein PilF
MSQLKLLLLGAPRVELGDVPLHIGRRKALALLAYLAVTGEPQRRETLVALLWPESEPSLAQSYLRRDLAVLNKSLGEGWLDADRERICLSAREDLWVDVHRFRRLLVACKRHSRDEVCSQCIPSLEQAVDLYRGEFMGGFTLPDCPDFDEWHFFEGEDLRRKLIEVLARLVHGYSTQGHVEAALSHARRWVALEPWHEPAHRELMQLYARSGNYAAALRQYEECTRVLEEELDQSPEQATLELYQALRVRRLPRPPSPKEAQATLSGREPEQPAPPVLPTRRHNLPPQLTPFVGRRQELTDIARLLRDPDCRLISLVGPGGIGKSRLALQAAAQNLGLFSNGVFLVSLAAIDSTDLIVAAIAEALALSLHGRADARTQVIDYLREKALLLLLDNFEHLLTPLPSSTPDAATTLVTDILSKAGGVKVLATSRERLNLHAEWVREVRGLPFPPSQISDASERIETYPAVQLFLENARRVRPGFFLSDADRRAVVRICQLVEGTPLGLELASAWVRFMPCQEIAQEMQRDFDFLSSSLRDIPSRHRDLRMLFEHSWELLSDTERAVVRRLSVFQGSFDRDAAAHVAGASLPELTALVDKSMLRGDPAGRFVMHGLLRQYAADKLQAHPEEHRSSRDQHCHTYAAFLRERETLLRGSGQREAVAEIAGEIDNVRAAWRWAIAEARVAEIGMALESLHLFYFGRSWYEEAEEAFRDGVAAVRSSPEIHAEQEGQISLVLGRLLARQARFAYRLGRKREAQALLDESLVLLRQIEGRGEKAARSNQAFPLYQLSEITRGDGDYAQAERLSQESLQIYREGDDRFGMARVLNHLGILAGWRGDYRAAQDLLGQALELYRAIDDPYGIANTLNDLGIVSDRLGQHDRARRLYEECLAIRRGIGHLAGVGASLNNLGFFAYLRGEYAEAKQLLEESLVIQREIGDRYEIANCLSNLGFAVCAMDQITVCRGYFSQALRIVSDIRHTPLTLEILSGVAVAMATGDAQEQKKAAELFACVLAHPASDQPTQDRAQRGLAELASALPSITLTTARERGQARDVRQVAAEILGDLVSAD